jgi:hypothetical protein
MTNATEQAVIEELSATLDRVAQEKAALRERVRALEAALAGVLDTPNGPLGTRAYNERMKALRNARAVLEEAQ